MVNSSILLDLYLLLGSNFQTSLLISLFDQSSKTLLSLNSDVEVLTFVRSEMLGKRLADGTLQDAVLDFFGNFA